MKEKKKRRAELGTSIQRQNLLGS